MERVRRVGASQVTGQASWVRCRQHAKGTESWGEIKGRVLCVCEPARGFTVKGNRDISMDLWMQFFYCGRKCKGEIDLALNSPGHFCRLCERSVVGCQAKQSRSLFDSNPQRCFKSELTSQICKQNELTFITFRHQPQVLRRLLSVGSIQSSRFKNHS